MPSTMNNQLHEKACRTSPATKSHRCRQYGVISWLKILTPTTAGLKSPALHTSPVPIHTPLNPQTINSTNSDCYPARHSACIEVLRRGCAPTFWKAESREGTRSRWCLMLLSEGLQWPSHTCLQKDFQQITGAVRSTHLLHNNTYPIPIPRRQPSQDWMTTNLSPWSLWSWNPSRGSYWLRPSQTPCWTPAFHIPGQQVGHGLLCQNPEDCRWQYSHCSHPLRFTILLTDAWLIRWSSGAVTTTWS